MNKEWNIEHYKFGKLTTDLIEWLRDDKALYDIFITGFPQHRFYIIEELNTTIEWKERRITTDFGYYDPVEDNIVIKYYVGMKKSVIIDTVIHEILHAILFKTSDDDELIVKELTFMIMRYNNFYNKQLSNKIIPERKNQGEVK
jgi:hypothetical protein